jgi:putative membrane protein
MADPGEPAGGGAGTPGIDPRLTPLIDPRLTPGLDPRLTLANERTLLAWTRTALAFMAAGLAVTQLFDRFGFPGGRRLVGMPLIVLGGVLAAASGRQWREREDAMRHGRPLPDSRLPWVVTASVVAIGLVAIVVAGVGTP